MRRSPSIVPPGGDQDVYLVLDDFGSGLGRAWRETDVEHTDLETVITDLLDGQCNNPVRVIGFTARIKGAICPSRCRNSLSGPRG
jgi:hypothetical protein